MRGRRNRQSSPVSLFSLQDIITCLTGIMILIVLVLALETLQTPLYSIATSQQTDAEIEAMIIELQKERDELVSRARIDIPPPPADPAEAIRRLIDLEKKLQVASSEVKAAEEKTSTTAALRDALRDKVQQLEDLYARRKLQFDQMEEQIRSGSLSRVRFLPGPRQTKTAHILEVSADSVNVFSLGTPYRDRRMTLDTLAASLVDLITSANPEKEFFVVMIKPSGIELGNEIVKELKKTRFQVGFDLLEEHLKTQGRSQP